MTGRTFRTAPVGELAPGDSRSMGTYHSGQASFTTNDRLAGVPPNQAALDAKEAKKIRSKKRMKKAKQVGLGTAVLAGIGEFVSGRVDRHNDNRQQELENQLAELESKDEYSEEVVELKEMVRAGRVEMLKKEEERRKADRANFIIGTTVVAVTVCAVGGAAYYGYHWWQNRNLKTKLKDKENEKAELEAQISSAIDGSDNEIIWRDKLRDVEAEIRSINRLLNPQQG